MISGTEKKSQYDGQGRHYGKNNAYYWRSSQLILLDGGDMNKSVSIIAILTIFTLIAGALAIDNPHAHAVSELPQAKSFTLSTLDGDREVSLEDFAGKAVVINFWATWCGPCREEMPLLQKEWEKFQNDNIEFIGIDVMDDKNLAAALIKEMGITYTNLHDASGKISNEYGVIALPATFFINKEGRVAIKNYGPFLGKEGEKKFRLYIEEISE